MQQPGPYKRGQAGLREELLGALLSRGVGKRGLRVSGFWEARFERFADSSCRMLGPSS